MPAGTHLDLLEPGRAVKLGLVALLHAELADVFGAAVVGGVLGVVDLLLLGRVDAPDVADQVAADLAERIAAKEPRLDVDPLEAEALRGEAGDFLVAELGADRQRLEILVLVHQPLEAATVARLDVDDLRDAVDRGVEVAALSTA